MPRRRQLRRHATGDQRLEPFGRLADQHRRAAASGDGIGECPVFEPLVLAAGDQHDLGGGEGVERADGGHRDRRLRIVHPRHPVAGRDSLEPMRDAAEVADAGGNRLDRDPDQRRGEGRS
jgi:hypothetical protein